MTILSRYLGFFMRRFSNLTQRWVSVGSMSLGSETVDTHGVDCSFNGPIQDLQSTTATGDLGIADVERINQRR